MNLMSLVFIICQLLYFPTYVYLCKYLIVWNKELNWIETVSIFSLLGSRMVALRNCHALTSPLAVECSVFPASPPTKELLSFRSANKIWPTRQNENLKWPDTNLFRNVYRSFFWLNDISPRQVVKSTFVTYFQVCVFFTLGKHPEICWLAYIFFMYKQEKGIFYFFLALFLSLASKVDWKNFW